jgi:hypothetical protein
VFLWVVVVFARREFSLPVFCVMMKNALYAGEVCSAPAAFFVGSISPYCLSWCMYQGTVMLSLVNWAGLIVNGAVAFLLPVLLVVLSYRNMRKYGAQRSARGQTEGLVLSASSLQQFRDGYDSARSGKEGHAALLVVPPLTPPPPLSPPAVSCSCLRPALRGPAAAA